MVGDGLEPRHRPAAVHDQYGPSSLDAVDEGTQLVLRLGTTGLLHIVHSLDAKGTVWIRQRAGTTPRRSAKGGQQLRKAQERDHLHAHHGLAVEMSEVFPVAGRKVLTPPRNRRTQQRDVLRIERHRQFTPG